MKIASLATVKAKLSEYVSLCRNEPVIITRNGAPAAMLVPVDEHTDLERLVLTHSPRLRKIIRQSIKSLDEGQGIPHEQFWAELDAEYEE